MLRLSKAAQRGRGSNPRPPAYEANALTTNPPLLQDVVCTLEVANSLGIFWGDTTSCWHISLFTNGIVIEV